MATQVQWRRGTTAQIAVFTGAIGEIVVDTTLNQLVVNDGVTVGGHYVAAASGGTLTNPTITGTVTWTTATWTGTITNNATVNGGTYGGNPHFTGAPTSTTPALPNASTLIATTAFVQNAVQFYAPLNLALVYASTMTTINSPGGT